MLRKLSIVVGFIGLLSCSHLSSPQKTAPPSILVIGLDGVSYETFKKMQDGGYFRNFNSVAPMISSFPSISDPNWDHIFDLGPEPGYTKSFFNVSAKTPRGVGTQEGSLLDHLLKEPEYEKAVDYKAEGAFEHLSTFVWTDTTAKYWLDDLEKSFFNFSNPQRKAFFSLIINTDILSHTEGEKSLLKFLARVDDHVDKIRKTYLNLYHQELEVIIISDHGNAYFQPKDIEFEKSLERDGWALSPTLSHARDVGFYVPEILSFGAFYCLEPAKRDLAITLARTPHVHTVMYEDLKGQIHIIGEESKAEGLLIMDQEKQTLSYAVLRGTDPLDQIHFFKNGRLSFEKYFEKTVDSPYPNALVRIWQGFHKNSITKAQVLVSPQLGWVFGNSTLRFFTKLRGFSSSHGSLHREETRGIFVSTLREFPPVRPEDVRRYIPVAELKTQ